MKKIFIFTLLFISSISFSNATVSGPTYIGSFKYSPENESVYFVENSQSGRGCPPVLKNISLASGKTETAFSCDQGEVLIGNNYQDSTNLVNQEISKITAGFKELIPISLSNNSLEIDINFVKSTTLDTDPDWIISSEFTASIYQNKIKIAEFPITGCNKEQPFTFAGYAIPGFQKKIILLSQTKGDCWEGGYISERLHVISGINSLNTEHSYNEYKTPYTPLVPNEATLTILESEKVDAISETNEPKEIKTSYNILITSVIVVLLLAFGLILGRITKK